MSTFAARALFLAFALVTGQASSDSASEPELRQRIAELRRLLNEDNSRIHGLEDGAKGSTRSDRRLEEKDKKPTIYWGDKGNFVWMKDTEYRAYTQEEQFAGAMDHMWAVLCGALVMFMQAGFAMLEAGVCRAKNAQAILLKNFTDVCAGSIGWYIFGWSFAFSGPFNDKGFKENGFMGYEEFVGHTFLPNTPEAYGLDHQIEPTGKMKMWFFQWAFCSAAATIVSGGVAERVNFLGYCIFSFVMSAWIYPIVVAWTWGMGFLASMNDVGYMDFAGSGIVHMAGGIGALIGAAIAGPRKDRFGTEAEPYTRKQRMLDCPDQFIPHNSPLMVLGTFILWFGWYGFNCGSTLGMHTAAQGMLAASVAMNTTISAATGGLTVFLIRYGMYRKYDIGGLCNGILAGLVAVTAPCGNVEAGTALFIGLVGGFIYQGTSLCVKALGIDDVVDAFAVHGANGLWGVLAAALFDWGQGFDHVHGWSGFNCLGYDAAAGVGCTEGLGGQLLIANICEILAIGGWVGLWTALLFFALKKANLLREADSFQDAGADIKKHSPVKAYQYGGNGDDDVPLHIV